MKLLEAEVILYLLVFPWLKLGPGCTDQVASAVSGSVV